MFMQDQVAVWDAVFFTYGLRAEWNPNYGVDANPYIVPRYGMAVTRDLGPVTTKLRAAYGSSTRPPNAGETMGRLVVEMTNDAQDYPAGAYFKFPSPGLVPEIQRGWEGGVETYLGARGSLSITRFNATVDNLIANAVVDSVDALPEVRLARGLRPWEHMIRQNQNLNMGSIRNTGWELRGSWILGSLTTDGTYSWTKSRIIGMTPKYRAQFPQYVVGAPFALMPEHTYSIGVRYVTAATLVGLDLQGQGFTLGTGANGEATWAWLDRPPRLPNEVPRVLDIPQIAHFVLPGYTKTNLTASRRLTTSCEGILQVDNLLNSYAGDYNALKAEIGRQTKLGLRIRLY
jgi:outer membrane receptor protein involved in Fe transport